MEILGQFWWVIVAAVVVVIGVVILSKKAKVKQEAIDQAQRDDSTILNVYNKINSSEIRGYMALPSLASRLAWLKLNVPEVMEAVERRYAESDYDLAIANNLDIRLLRDETVDRKSAIRIYRTTAIAMSLNEYQLILDKKNADYRKQLEVRAKAEAERRAKKAAELANQKKAAKKYWKSLSPEQKAAFKTARGRTARRNTLPATSSDYSVDILYPLIMAVQFSNVPDSSQSINYCESSSHGHSSGGHFDGGSTHDSGGSYGGGSSDGGGSSGGGDGGGGGGGGGGE